MYPPGLTTSADVVTQDAGALLALPPHELHLWLADYAEIDDESLLGRYRTLLSDAERAQESRFYFARDRRRYLVTRAMVRTLLSKYACTPPASWEFTVNDYGRPEIAAQCMPSTPLTFNVSHTDSLIAVVVARHRAIGIDVENVVTRAAALGIADHYFSAREVAALRALPELEQHYRFFEHWTFKESYIKARGMGLSLPLDKFGFEFPTPLTAQLHIDAELADEPRRWRLWQYRPTDEYLIALCAEQLDTATMSIVCRYIEPMRSERLIALAPLRVSG